MLSKLRKRLHIAPWERTLYIMFISQMMTAVGFSNIFPFLPLYVEDLGSTTGMSIEVLAGLVFSGQAVAMMIASPFWGILADRYGRKVMVERANYGAAVMLLLMAFARSGEELVILRTIQGLISGSVSANNALVAACAPRQRSGYAMGLLQVGQGAGVALGPVIGGLLADRFGYAPSFYITAGLIFLSGLLVTFGIREDFDRKVEMAKPRTPLMIQYRSIFRTTGIPTTYSLRLLSHIARMLLVPILPFFAIALIGESDSANSYIGLILGAASGATTLSGVYLGKLSDRRGPKRVLVMSALGAAMFSLATTQVTAGWHLLVLQILTGVCVGGIIPTLSSLLARYSKEGEEGAVYGLDNSVVAGGRAIAPTIGGLIAASFPLTAIFWGTAVVYFSIFGIGLSLPNIPAAAGDALDEAIGLAG